MEFSKYQRCSEITRGLRKADLVLKNAKIINVYTEEILEGDIAITEGTIAAVGSYHGIKEVDLQGKYVCPGFIDSHLHLESTLVTPAELIHRAVPCGTTTFIVDPHESANVSGLKGVDYILDQTEEVPANVYLMMPSCVPSTEIDDNGCRLTAELMKPYVKNKRILGLGEVMDYISVVESSFEMHSKLALFENKILDGHAPFLNDQDLQAYAMAGIVTDHECVDFEYALKERRNGMNVLIREGSAAKNLEAIITGMVANRISIEGFSFCTDDKHIEDIDRDGHINYNIRKAVSLGIDPVKAIKMATLNPAKCYGLKHLGAVSAGCQADLVVFDDLMSFQIKAVYYKGNIVEKAQKAFIKQCPPELKKTIHLDGFTRDKLALPMAEQYHIIELEAGQITTKDLLTKKPASGLSGENTGLLKIAAIERHAGTGKVGVGLVSGYGLRNGAVASSVSHDSHNIIVIGDNDEDMELAVHELIHSQGGYTIIQNHKIFDTLELPIMGLMSDAGFDTVHNKLKNMIDKAHQMGVPLDMDPFITLSFVSLPVIPEIRITPRGIYNVRSRTFY